MSPILDPVPGTHRRARGRVAGGIGIFIPAAEKRPSPSVFRVTRWSGRRQARVVPSPVLHGWLLLLALALVGCLRSQSMTVGLDSEGEIVLGEGLALPAIHLESDGQTIEGSLSSFSWASEDGSSVWGGEHLIPEPPAFPGELRAGVGQSVDLVVTPAARVPILTITELDDQERLIRRLVLQPEANRYTYLLYSERLALLELTAQWSVQDFITYRFAVKIQP